MTPVCVGPIDDDVPAAVGMPDPEDPTLVVTVGAVGLTPRQMARVSFWARLADRPVSQFQPYPGIPVREIS